MAVSHDPAVAERFRYDHLLLTGMDGDNFGDGEHEERRRHLPAGQSSMDILRQLPPEPSCSPMQRLAR